jgi:hypothetical protein
VRDYEDASAPKRALAGIDDMVLISSDGDANAVMRHHANAREAAGSPFRERHAPSRWGLDFTTRRNRAAGTRSAMRESLFDIEIRNHEPGTCVATIVAAGSTPYECGVP